MKRILLWAMLACATQATAGAMSSARGGSRSVPVAAGGPAEVWTLDQIRFPAPKDPDVLAPLEKDHSLAAVMKHLGALGIRFERSTVEIETSRVPEDIVAQINVLPAAEPFVIPDARVVTINVILARRPAKAEAGAGGAIPLPSPGAAQVVVRYDITPDGKVANCTAEGALPDWMGAAAAFCRTRDVVNPDYRADGSGQGRRVAITLGVSVVATDGAVQ